MKNKRSKTSSKVTPSPKGWWQTSSPLAKKRKRPEAVLETHFKRWLSYTYPEVYKVSYKIPNEGKRNPIHGRLMALTPGIPDFCIPVARGPYHALYIEFKIKPNTPTPEQVDMIGRLQKFDNLAVVCYTLDECIAVTTSYLEGNCDKSFSPPSMHSSASLKEDKPLLPKRRRASYRNSRSRDKVWLLLSSGDPEGPVL